jgi:aminopeptidase-like protein
MRTVLSTSNSPNAALIPSGEELYRLIVDLYPLCRSITGDGLRATLRRLGEVVPLTMNEVPSGTPVFDWTVPREWNIHDAYIKNSRGERVVDFRKSNLHVVNYSVPVHRRMSVAELKPFLFTLPDHPDWIPYRTSYYKEGWGFCLTHRQLEQLSEDQYEVSIDSTLKDGHLTYGEFFLAGRSEQEVIISCHACHPSLCNDNLSGLTIAAFLARYLSSQPRRYSYRFLFIPGTIGAIVWLSSNEDKVSRIAHGLVLSCLGDAGKFSYKKSRRGIAEIDRAVAQVLKDAGLPYELQEFTPYGYDERQFCSPGFNLPVGRLSRTPNGCYPEYHTSADNLDFVQPEYLKDSFDRCCAIVSLLERNSKYINLNPKCEPQLGKRGLYHSIGGLPDAGEREMAMLWVLNLSDGGHSLLDIAERANLSFNIVFDAAKTLQEHGLLASDAVGPDVL